jgi:hypothetical protein
MTHLDRSSTLATLNSRGFAAERFSTRTRSLFCAVAGICAMTATAHTGASEVGYYSFPAAAQEITQLFWLAETASACGWASREETERFELFAVRFLAAHLEGANKLAFVALAEDENHRGRVKYAALEYAGESCKLSRWRAGWDAYKAAADENHVKY